MVNDMSLTVTDPVTVASRIRPVLLHLGRHLRRELLASLGVTGGQATLLAVIHSRPGIGVRELAAREGMSAAAISGHVDRLEKAGLVTRARPSEGDRRRVGLELTAEGGRILRAVRSRRTAWLAARLKSLSGDELCAVEAAIGPLQRLLEEPA